MSNQKLNPSKNKYVKFKKKPASSSQTRTGKTSCSCSISPLELANRIHVPYPNQSEQMNQRENEDSARNSASRLSPRGDSTSPCEPNFRSVMIMHMPLSEPGLLSASPPSEQVKVKPLRVPAPLLQTVKPSRSSSTVVIPPVTVGWDQSCCVTRLGAYHPLEVAHVRFSAEAQERVLKLVVECFKALSLRTMYHDSPVAADCQSMEQVEFRVNFWRCRNHSDQNILEIQRLHGDSVTYCNYAKQILSSVNQDLVCLAPQRHLPMPTLLEAEATLQSAFGDTLEDPSVPALEICHGLLFSDRFDARRLGLESLCIMTESGKTGINLAACVSEAILLGTLPNASSPMLRLVQERILRLVTTGCYSDSRSGEVHEHDRYLALVALCNALKSIDVQKMPTALSECQRLASCSLVDVLLQKVANATEHPHEAYFSLQALEVLISSGKLGHPDIVPVVERAYQFGSAAHEALATVSERVLVALQV